MELCVFCKKKVWVLSVWKLFLVSILSVCKHSSHTLIKVFSNYNNFADATFDWNQNVSVEKDFWIKKVTNTPTIDPCILAYQEWNSPARMFANVGGKSIRFDKQMGVNYYFFPRPKIGWINVEAGRVVKTCEQSQSNNLYLRKNCTFFVFFVTFLWHHLFCVTLTSPILGHRRFLRAA